MGASAETHGESDRRGSSARRRGQGLIVAGFLVLAMFVVGLAYWAWREQARSIRDSAEGSLVAIAELQSGQIDTWLNERRGDAEVIRSDTLLAAAVTDLLGGRGGAETEANVRAQLAAIQEHYHYVDLVLVDRSGAIVAREPEDESHALGAPVRALVRTTLRTRCVEMTDLYLDAAGDERLEMASPVLADEPGAPAIAAVVLHIDPNDFLYPLVQDWPLESVSGETLLVQRHGDRVVYLNELRHRKNTALRLTYPLSDPDLPSSMAVRGASGVVEGVDYRGVPVIAALKPVPDVPWFIVAKMDTTEVLGPIERRAWLTAGFTVLVVLLAAAGTLLLWRARESQVDAELVASEAKFRSLFETMTEGVATHELVRDAGGEPIDYRVVDVNPAYVAQTGLPPEQIRDMLATDAYETRNAPYLDIYAQAVAEDAPRRFESYVEPLGRHFQMSVMPQGGDRFATIFEDITERKIAEDEIERLNTELEQRVFDRTSELDAANKELEAFAYSVSHDLRAPLRHVSGFAALLADWAGDGLDEKSRHYVERISASVREMGVLIDDLLQFSRTGRAELTIEAVDMDAALAEALEPMRREADGREIEWSIAPLPDVVADHALLRQVWANLLGNAVKYTRGRAPARIEVGAGDGDTDEYGDVFFVRDNGVGFDMEYAHKLFGVFQRLHSAREFEGAGIGLANVHRIITRLGGRVWAEGKPDQGATFYFSLPRRKETAP